MGFGLAAGLAVLAVCGVVGWMALAGGPVDGLERVRSLPLYPGASSVAVEERPVTITAAGSPVGVVNGAAMTFETQAEADEVFAFYDDVLKRGGWQAAGRQSDGGGGQYMKREGSFQGIEFTGGSGGGFPWVRIKRSQALLWVQVEISTVERDDGKWSEVAVETMQP
jgi:hypothetical protein